MTALKRGPGSEALLQALLPCPYRPEQFDAREDRKTNCAFGLAALGVRWHTACLAVGAGTPACILARSTT